MNERLQHGRGWRPDLPDFRDLRLDFAPDARKAGAFTLEHSADMPPILDQGNLGSCTAFGSLRCFDFAQHCETQTFLDPSHLFQYYNTRALEGTEGTDAGGTIRDAMKALAKYGVCAESTWPYIIARYRRDPSRKCYDEAKHHQSIKYMRVERRLIPHAITAGFPVVFGATLYTSFESPGPTKANGYLIPMPGPSEQVLGGHCMVVVGYDDARKAYRVANSWGTSWGERGYFWMPYAYLDDPALSSDFWTLQYVEIPE